MKSISWLGSSAWRSGLVALCGGVALALVATGCTKDAESRSLAVSPAAPPAGEPGTAPAPGAAMVRGPGAAEAPPTAGAGEAEPLANQADDDTYSIQVDTPAAVASGAEGVVRVRVTPLRGWKMNMDYPTRLRVTAPDGVAMAKAEQSIGDAERFDDAGGIFAVKFTAGSAGDKSFQAKFRFAVCTDATCVPNTRDLAWMVKVQ
jgi:hypothetical protein